MSKTLRISILCVSLCLISVAVHSQIRNQGETFEGHDVVAREVIVKFRPVSREAIARVMAEHDLAFVEGVGDAVLLRSSRRDVATLVRLLTGRAEVEYAEPNYIVRAIGDGPSALVMPNDPSFGTLYGLHNTGQTIQGQAGIADADIDAVEAWDTTTGSHSIVLASIDTGVDFDHPDLAANIWQAPTQFTVNVGGVNITCPAGTSGFNAITNSCGGADDNNHGTHTSGTMGAVGDNGVGVAGVNWNVSIMGCKFLSASGSGSTADATQCLEWVRKTRAFFGKAGGDADVVATNNSWGGGGRSFTLGQEIGNHGEAGILFVASAGNNGRNTDLQPQYPAGYTTPNVMSIAATDNRDNLAGFSNFGANSVDLGAPGVATNSTVNGGGYAFFNGTSMAAPHVSGAVALLKAACPSLGHLDLKNTIMNTVDPVASLNGKTVTGGRLNVASAIATCNTPSRSR